MNARAQSPSAPAPARSDRKSTQAKAGVAPTAKGLNGSTKASANGAPAAPPAWLRSLDCIIGFFTSLRLTVVCLTLGMVLVFAGTLAQVDLGLFKAQNEYFRSFLVWWGPKGAGWRIPILPGGYLVGGVLLINLVAAHIKRFSLSKGKVGIWMVHFGLILLLLGQLGTDLLSRESMLHLREGDTKNYSESDRQFELAVIDTTAPDLDKVVAIPEPVLMHRKEIRHAELPFTVLVKNFFVNSMVEKRAENSPLPPAASRDIGSVATVRELPRVTQMDFRDRPSAVVEIVTPQGSLGTWLVSDFVTGPQSFSFDNHNYQLGLRLRRYYQPFSIQLLRFRHDVYAGTDVPKNFSSRIQLNNPNTGENREVLIKMNSPLRYSGETYYQASFDLDNGGTILEVVHNPSWLTPYLACVLVGLGLVVQFATHLFGFSFKRKAA